jgi:hypothetical protein
VSFIYCSFLIHLAHNYCDAAASHVKKKMAKYIKSFYLLSNVSHLSFCCAELKNTYMFEVDVASFPEVHVASPEAAFMRNAFSFAYEAPELETATCNCKCKSKKTCAHKCCKGVSVMSAKVSVGMRDGSVESHFLRSRDAVSDGDLERMDKPDTFWGTFSDQQRLVPKNLVRARVIDHDESDFDYDGVSYDDNESDLDYV